MKTALLHYWLTNRRGGEKVFRELCRMMPEGDVFTHAYNSAVMDGWFGGRKVTESFIGRWFPRARTCCQAYLPFMPLASRRFDLSDYELIVSSESGPVKGVRKRSDQRHVCYCHTPMRYLWDMHDDYYRAAGPLGKLAMKLWTGYLRREDLKSAECVDTFVANSQFVAERIRRIYGREATVVHPPVDVDSFTGDYEKDDYYLLAGQLIDYKRPDLALSACVKMGRRIVVAGAGKLLPALRRAYADNPLVDFRGRVDDETLRTLYGRARALIFPGVEDFGIVPVEAQAAGTPVVAYGKGGALETVADGSTGLLFAEASVESLCCALESFEGRRWSPEACRKNAVRFNRELFVAGMNRVLQMRLLSK